MRRALSVGTDVVDIQRMHNLIRNRRFIERVFSPEEILYCQTKKNAAQHYAVRFAAKESVWKALSGLWKGNGISHREISIRNNPSGKPTVFLSNRLKRFEKNFSISLSHTDSVATAVAIYQS